jgi:hypothetical protein
MAFGGNQRILISIEKTSFVIGRDSGNGKHVEFRESLTETARNAAIDLKRDISFWQDYPILRGIIQAGDLCKTIRIDQPSINHPTRYNGIHGNILSSASLPVHLSLYFSLNILDIIR